MPIALIKSLRERTGAPMSECKEALEASLGNGPSEDAAILARASDFLRKKGVATASKKSSRSAAEGLVAVTLSNDRRNAAVVELNCETDFASKSPQFAELLTSIASHALHLPANSNIDELKSVKSTTGSTLGEVVQESVVTIRENLQLRRFARFSVNGNGCLGYYVHNVSPASPEQMDEGQTYLRFGRQGCLIELETSGPANTEIQTLANQVGFMHLGPHLTYRFVVLKQIAMHAVAAQPLYLSKDAVPADVLSREIDVVTDQARQTGKPEQFIKKIVDGRLAKFFEDTCLLQQRFVLSDDNNAPRISEVLKQASTQHGRLWLSLSSFSWALPSDSIHRIAGVDITLRNFAKLAVGEGVEIAAKKSFSEEVQEKMQSA